MAARALLVVAAFDLAGSDDFGEDLTRFRSVHAPEAADSVLNVKRIRVAGEAQGLVVEIVGGGGSEHVERTVTHEGIGTLQIGAKFLQGLFNLCRIGGTDLKRELR